jgi:acyl-CoA synthetase (AMP-forming)/AMP-acid ligase II
LIEALDRAAEGDDPRGVTIVDEQGGRERRSWSRIWTQARRIAAALRLEGIERLDRILLAFPTGFEFLGAFFGALSIGALPVPAPLPSRWQRGTTNGEPLLATLGRRMNTRAILVDPDVDTGERPSPGTTQPWSLIADVPTLLEDVPVGLSIDEAIGLPDLGYIQLTEGATGLPRGVLLTHDNICSNVSAIGDTLDVGETDVGVSWIPLHNPLGLIGVVCFGVVFDIELVLLDPAHFLKRPESWLQAIDRHDGTLSTAPNFAYDYAVRRCRESELEGLDLSSWRVAMSGGEPVRAQHLESFARRFAEYGLQNDVFTPVYGLSEATLGVTFGSVDGSFRVDAINRRVLETEGRAQPLPDTGAPTPSERMHLVSVGEPLDGVECRIVDDDGEPVAPRVLGEIALRGPNLMRGYVGSEGHGVPPSDSEHADRTHVESGWLRTGDLGYRADDRLYVVGRACDRIELPEGRTIFPEEVELFVDAVDGVYAGRTVVFDGTADGDSESPELVVAFELQSGAEREAVEASVRDLLGHHLALEPDELLALSPRSIPRTKSGKVRRPIARAFHRIDRLDRCDRQARWPNVRRLWRRVRERTEQLGRRLGDRFETWLG